MTTTQLNDEKRRRLTATISSGQTTSEELTTDGWAVLALILPAALTGTSFTIEGSIDGTTFNDVYDSDGVQFSIPVAVDRYVVLDPSIMAGLIRLKFVSSGSEAADRTLELLTAEV